MGIAAGLHDSLKKLCSFRDIDTVVLSGGVFQNELLLSDLKNLVEPDGLKIWTNHAVPANDGGISLGQAAMAALSLSQSSAVTNNARDTRRNAAVHK
ncbi:MAG: hypothetical protein M3N22_01240 [Acidobacteriota bacterium]|nr:hypothetical protein [Acidobacteriota bacterium]